MGHFPKRVWVYVCNKCGSVEDVSTVKYAGWVCTAADVGHFDQPRRDCNGTLVPVRYAKVED